jgi:hypothetical protein
MAEIAEIVVIATICVASVVVHLMILSKIQEEIKRHDDNVNK